jgi:putative phage-type endonuclease
MEYLCKVQILDIVHQESNGTHLKTVEKEEFAIFKDKVLKMVKDKCDDCDGCICCDNAEEHICSLYEMKESSYTLKRSMLKMTDLPKTYFAKRASYLRTVPQYEQRTPEWYKAREDMISASDIATAIGMNPYQKKKDLILKKCNAGPPFRGNKFTQWGVKYEQVATLIYEFKEKETVVEYGLILHEDITFIGASPDGITLSGIMLEIKCPYTRNINKKGKYGLVPAYYWVQVQIQLEVCKLKYCDFEQCKFSEYRDRDDFIYDASDCDYVSDDGQFKGAVAIWKKNEYETEWDKYDYSYPPKIDMSIDELDEWIESESKRKCDDKIFRKVTYWKLEEYSCVRVERDREWFLSQLPDIESCWNEILHRRIHGVEDILPKKRVTKPKAPSNDACFF